MSKKPNRDASRRDDADDVDEQTLTVDSIKDTDIVAATVAPGRVFEDFDVKTGRTSVKRGGDAIEMLGADFKRYLELGHVVDPNAPLSQIEGATVSSESGPTVT